MLQGSRDATIYLTLLPTKATLNTDSAVPLCIYVPDPPLPPSMSLEIRLFLKPHLCQRKPCPANSELIFPSVRISSSLPPNAILEGVTRLVPQRPVASTNQLKVLPVNGLMGGWRHSEQTPPLVTRHYAAIKSVAPHQGRHYFTCGCGGLKLAPLHLFPATTTATTERSLDHP